MPKPSLLTGIHAHEFSCANQKNAQQPLYLQSWPRKVRLRAKKTRFLPYAPSSARTAPLTNAEGLALRPRRLTPLSPRSQAGVRARISAPQKGEEARRLRQKKSEPNAIVAPPNLTRRSPQKDRQGARHDRVPQVPRQLVLVCALIKMPRRLVNLRVDLVHPTHWLICAQVLELGQGRLSGEAETRGRGRRFDGADPAHRARGVAARPLVLSRQRGAARYAYAAGPRRAAVGPQSLPRQRLFDA